jgi:DNA invertase Pin-like site-specific DNA recombinase
MVGSMAGKRKITDKQWLEIKQMYEMGVKVRDIAAKYDYDHANIIRKAKKLGWINGSTMQIVQAKAEAIKDIITIDAHLHQNKSEFEREIINERVLELAELKYQAQTYQSTMFDVLNLAANQAKKIVANNVDGTYIKAEGANGTTYGLTSEIIRNLTPAMTAANAILGVGKETAAVQINNNAEETSQVKIYIPDNKRNKK